MDLKQLKQVMEDLSRAGGIMQKKESLISDHRPTNAVESSTALQLFLDHIPIASIPGINNPSAAVLELKTGDCLGDAIQLLYEKNVFGALIAADSFDTNSTSGKNFLDRYIGFIDFARMVLWSLEECERSSIQANEDIGGGIFSMLERNPRIARTKIGELAKSFLWDPFFPVHLDDTLFHVLLLLSKHRLQFVPVTEQSSSKVIGFVTSSAVIQLLLQSNGLEWFDSIADKALSEFRFENDEHAVFVYGDQSVTETMHVLWENQIGAVAVVQRETKRLIGCVRNSDLHLLLDNNDLFNNRRSLTAEEFIHMDGGKADSDPTIERDLGAFLSAGILKLRNNFLPRMDSPVTNRNTDTLKQAMKNLAATKCNFCFLVDELQQVQGVITLRDMIVQFAPPSMDSTINGGGFFDSALEQTGCHIENGTMVCDH
ncbi:SNF1-related protein kinase regulatory subunit gamma-1 like [Actinidia chinensis var. chinensis]|uniref:SNF1-related protein kinase regulatory subunit gamma-1 like n=1 Tax=Actinidia chinensis var. chinensis TaxID=1590841 RepID=A0A2R6R1K7_ACTCC|nr:SNF1-related protein kinase regulatory subunit gamma-1 like [Actinidia chinensis var. chinensis]